MQNVAAPRIEFRWGWVIPALLVFALLLNYGIAQASPVQSAQFAPVVVRASFLADYSRDAAGLRFAPVSANLVADVLRDQGRELGEEDLSAFGALTPTPAASPSPTLAATPTPLLGQPTLGATLPPLVTQVVGGVGDTVGSVVDGVGDTLDDVGDAVDDVTDTTRDVVDDTLDAVETLVPIVPCIPLPLIRSCP